MKRANSSEKARALLAVGHLLLREAVREIVEQQPNIQVVGVVANGLLAVEGAKQLQPHIILMDIRLPDMRAAEAVPLVLGQRLAVRWSS